LGQIAKQRVSLIKAFPMQPIGDNVTNFGEAAAAPGFLGRFPGSEVMPLVQHFVGMKQK